MHSSPPGGLVTGMPRFIVKLERGPAAWYLEWSTVVDAPVSYGMPLAEFREYVRAEEGSRGLAELDARLERAEAQGTSLVGSRESARDAVAFNRAGPSESCLTYDELVEEFCINRPPAAPKGQEPGR